MGGKRSYNYELFPRDTRVKVHAASPMEGSDHEWHGYVGTIIENGKWVLVRMDKKPRHWPSNEVLLCNHNLRAEKPDGDVGTPPERQP